MENFIFRAETITRKVSKLYLCYTFNQYIRQKKWLLLKILEYLYYEIN